jgi:hypothetical protein
MPEPTAVIDHAAHSGYSDPGTFASLFDEIEPTVESVSSMARNVVAHYRAQATELPESSRDDISLRWIDSILATDQQRHASSLTVKRPVGERVQGCCRDHTLLAVSALRQRGVPARSRVGFETYLSPTWNHDHVIVEAWFDGRWRRFDPEFAPAVLGSIDTSDLSHGPDSAFLTAAQVWTAHRAGSLDVSRFGVAQGLGIGGDWFVHGYVIAQVAHRFGDELLLWDIWGAMHDDLAAAPAEDVALIDEVAQLLIRADEGDAGAERELHDRYRNDDRLHPGAEIRSASPNGGLFEVALTTRTARRIE